MAEVQEVVEIVEVKDNSSSEGEEGGESQLTGSETLNSSQEIVEDQRTINLVEVDSPSPRKARRIARNYRQTNKNESSESENEKLHNDKKHKNSPSDKRKRRIHVRKNSTDENKNISEDKVSRMPILRRSHVEKLKENGHHRNLTDDEYKTELQHIHEGIQQRRNFFDDSMCRKIEKKIDQIAEKAKRGAYQEKTYDTAPLRNKYFFGEGYTYGKQMKQRGLGQEQLYPKGIVDPIPKWIEKHIIKKLYNEKIVPEGFITSAVVNEYFPGGCIVSHVDPIQIFDRPIISISFNSNTFLSFGVKFSFNPIRTTEPILALPLDRGCLTMISGYAADNVTHCIRPQDITERRCVIILRRTFPDAPRIGDEDYIPKAPLRVISTRYDARNSINRSQRPIRKRTRTSYYEHNNRDEGSSKKRKTRHSY